MKRRLDESYQATSHRWKRLGDRSGNRTRFPDV